MVDSETLRMLREDLRDELTAINNYQKHIDAVNDKEFKKTLSHIRDEEKEHVAEIVKLLRELDSMQDKKFEKESLE